MSGIGDSCLRNVRDHFLLLLLLPCRLRVLSSTVHLRSYSILARQSQRLRKTQATNMHLSRNVRKCLGLTLRAVCRPLRQHALPLWHGPCASFSQICLAPRRSRALGHIDVRVFLASVRWGLPGTPVCWDVPVQVALRQIRAGLSAPTCFVASRALPVRWVAPISSTIW